MPTPETLMVFAAATLLMLVVPGPSVVYVVTRAVERGSSAALWSLLGLESALLVHVLAAALGISAIVVSSPLLFEAIRYAGAAYLVLLGVRALRDVARLRPATVVASRIPIQRWQLFRDGFIVDLLNPKTALFFLAFLPQFVDPERGSAIVQTLVLGMGMVPLAALCDSGYALLAVRLSGRLRRSSGGVLPRMTGGVYLALAVGAVVL